MDIEFDPVSHEFNELIASIQNELDRAHSEQEYQPTKPVGILDPHDTDPAEQMPVDISELLQNNIMYGTISYDAIIEAIKNQFDDYINTDDRTNYLVIFTKAIAATAEGIVHEDDFHDEKLDVIQNMIDDFISTMSELIRSKLNISIRAIDDENTETNAIRVINEVYEYFILNAPDNFKIVLAKDLLPKLGIGPENDQFVNEVYRRILDYSPYITTITPTEFLEMSNGDDVKQLYDDVLIVGNFLNRYTMKLYQNPDFEADLVSYLALYEPDEMEANANGKSVSEQNPDKHSNQESIL